MLIGRPTGKRRSRRPRRRWEETIRMSLEEIDVNRRIWLIGLRIGIIDELL